MRAVMVMFDSLNRHFLPNFGNKTVVAPNFERLEEHTVKFNQNYAGSLPCMPARRELHTGRYNFLHRSWGPIEPFDDSMPQILSEAGIHTHLVSDHGHYWEDGGSTYHQRYTTWEISRGQEGDPWIGEVKDIQRPSNVLGRWSKQDHVNRQVIGKEENAPQTITFDRGIDFIKRNINETNWFVQIETFDPHEPFVSPDSYLELYQSSNSKIEFDWPDYTRVSESCDEVEHVRNKYMALLSMCDKNLGRVLDLFDENNLWEDTMLIVNTDHGFLLGEHGWWAKCVQPFYQEITHIPLFIWDPRIRINNVQRDALVQTIDLAPTLLSFFDIPPTKDMQGKDLMPVIKEDFPIREAILFGMHGGHINCLWNNHVYMRAPLADRKKRPTLYNYTLMPMHMRSLFSLDEIQNAEFGFSFRFTKDCPLLRFPATFGAPGGEPTEQLKSYLYNLSTDAQQLQPIEDKAIEKRMIEEMTHLMQMNDAPPELYEIFGLSSPL